MKSVTLATILVLGLAPALHAQGGGPSGVQGSDCLAEGLTEAQFRSQALGDGRYLYQVELTNRSRTASLRYSYSFALPGSARPAEALNGYLTPGASIEHALGAGSGNLSAEALRAATSLRCFPL